MRATDERVVIGMDPHKRSVTIEVMAADEEVLGGGRFGTDVAGFKAMLEYVTRWPNRVWAIEGCNGIGVHFEPTWEYRQTTAWSHLTKQTLADAVASLPRLRSDAYDARPCTHGPCAWCGRVLSTRWTLQGHRWADGSQAPLCSGCEVVYLRRGAPMPSVWNDQRAAISEAITGVPVMMGEHHPDGLLGYAEAGRDEDEDEDEAREPWSHLPAEALETYRWAKWTRHPRHAPPEHQAEARERARGVREGIARSAAEKAATEKAAADVYGFGVKS